MKKYRLTYPYTAAFLLPVCFILTAFMIFGFAPFGEKNLCAIDGFGQYFPMLRERERCFFSGDTFSFSGLLGLDLRAQNAYYTNSPLWIPFFLLPGELTASEVDLAVCLRFGLAGLGFFSYISGRFGAAKRNRYSDLCFIVLSAAYACSGYMLAFINQFMWADSVILLPLVVSGIERLVHRKRPGLYFISLSLCIYSCFYTAYMVCLFACLWFAGCLILSGRRPVRPSRNELLKTLLLFASASLAAGLVNLPVLLPLIKALRKTAAASLRFDGKIEFYGYFPEMFARFLPFQKKSLVYGPPNLYCGILTLLPAAAFFADRRIRLREKLLRGGLILFLLLSFDINLLNYIWHGFHYPNQLPGRQSFLLIFTLLSTAAGSFGNGPAAAGRTSGASAVMTSRKDTATAKRSYDVRMLRPVFCLLVFAELFGNTLYAVRDAAFVYQDTLCPYDSFVSEAAELLTPDTEHGEFYRTEICPSRDNGGQLYGYPGISYYSSTMPEAAYRFFTRLGCPIYAKNVSTRFAYDPELYDIFGVRYLISDTAIENTDLQLIKQADGHFLYENPDTLPLCFFADDSILRIPDEAEGEELQAMLLQAVRNAPAGHVDLIRVDPGRIRCETVCDRPALLLCTLPYDGARVTVDGESMPLCDTAGLSGNGESAGSVPALSYLLGISLPEGRHEILIRF